MTPQVTAVVLNWCGEEDTTACLRSLARSEYPNLDILLVDNGSRDGSGVRLHEAFPHLPYLQTGSNLGYTGGNNRGIAWAEAHGAEYVLVLNNDTTIGPDAVGHLVEAAESDERVGAVAPKILRADDPRIIWYAGGRFSALRGLGFSPDEGETDAASGKAGVEEVTFVTGCACLLSMPALQEAGSFAEDFFAYVEDAELSLRLRRRGYRLLYQPAARVFHSTGANGSEPTPFQIRMRDRNRRRLMRRHFSLLRRMPFLVRFYATRMVHLGRYAARRDRRRFAAILRGMYGS